jgi:FlaA1/EpsC-like NDP-sugar epimerase
MIAYDAASYSASASASLLIVVGPEGTGSTALAIAAISVLVAVPIHWLFGLYSSIVRYTGLSLLFVGTKATLTATAIIITASALGGILNAPIRVGAVYWAFSLILIVGGRVSARMFLSRSNADREPVIIYGAGQAGAQLISALFDGDGYLPVALVDDNPRTHGQRIHELKVYSTVDLHRLIETAAVKRILLAMPAARSSSDYQNTRYAL